MSNFTEEDLVTLQDTIAFRKNLLSNYISKKGLPTAVGDINALVNLSESVDRSILTKTKIKVDESATATQAQSKAILQQMLLILHGNKDNITVNASEHIPTYQSKGIELTDGEVSLRDLV